MAPENGGIRDWFKHPTEKGGNPKNRIKEKRHLEQKDKLFVEKGKEIKEVTDQTKDLLGDFTKYQFDAILPLIDDDNILNTFEGEAKLFQFRKYRQMRATDMLEFGGSLGLGTLLLTIKQDIGDKQFVANIKSLYNKVYGVYLGGSDLEDINSQMTDEIQQNRFKLLRMFSGRINNLLRDGVNNVSLPSISEAKSEQTNENELKYSLEIYEAGFARFVESNNSAIGTAAEQFANGDKGLSKKDIKALQKEVDKITDESQKNQYEALLGQSPQGVNHALFLQSLFLGYIHDTTTTTTNTTYQTVTETIIKETKTDIDGNVTIIKDNSNDPSRFSKPQIDKNEDGTDEITTEVDKKVTHLLTIGAQGGIQITKRLQGFIGAGVGTGLQEGKIIGTGGSIYTGVSQQIYKSLSASATGVLGFIQGGVSKGAALWLNWSPKLNKAEQSGKAQANLVVGAGVGADLDNKISKDTLAPGAYVGLSLDKVGGINGFVNRMDHVLHTSLTDVLLENKLNGIDQTKLETKLSESFDADTSVDLASRLMLMIKASDLSELSGLIMKKNITELDKASIDVAIKQGLTEPLIRNIATERRQDTRKVNFGGVVVSWSQIAAAVASGGVTIVPSILTMGIGSTKFNTVSTTKNTVTSQERSSELSVETYTANLDSLTPYFNDLTINPETGEISYVVKQGYSVMMDAGDEAESGTIGAGSHIIVGVDGTIKITHQKTNPNDITIAITQPSQLEGVKTREVWSEVKELAPLTLPTSELSNETKFTDEEWISIKSSHRLVNHFKPLMDTVYLNGAFDSKLLAELVADIRSVSLDEKKITIDDTKGDLITYEQLLYIRNKLTTSSTFAKIKSDPDYKPKKVKAIQKFLDTPQGKEYQNKTAQEQLFGYRTSEIVGRIDNEGRTKEFKDQYLAVRHQAFTTFKDSIRQPKASSATFAINTGYDTPQLSEIFNVNPTYIGGQGGAMIFNNSQEFAITNAGGESTTTPVDELACYFIESITKQTPLFVNYFKGLDSRLNGMDNAVLAEKICQSVRESKGVAPYTITLDGGEKIEWRGNMSFGFDFNCMNESMDIQEIAIKSQETITTNSDDPIKPSIIKITKDVTVKHKAESYDESVVDMTGQSTNMAAGIGKMARDVIINKVTERVVSGGITTDAIDTAISTSATDLPGKNIEIQVDGQTVLASFVEVNDPIQGKVIQINYTFDGKNFVMTVKQDVNGALIIGSTNYTILSTVEPGYTIGGTVVGFPGTVVPPVVVDTPAIIIGGPVENFTTTTTAPLPTVTGEYTEVASDIYAGQPVISSTTSNVANIIQKDSNGKKKRGNNKNK